MKYLFFLIGVLRDELTKRFFYLKAFLFALCFVILATVLLNYKSYWSFITADYDLLPKINILWLIFKGSLSTLEAKDALFLIITSLLFGLNMELVLRKLRFLRTRGGLHVTLIGGILTITATGCASCGLSLASLVGLGGAIALLPFGGIELYIVSIIILFASLLYNLHIYVKACNIKPNP